MALVAEETGVSVVAEAAIDGTPVTLSVAARPVGEVLELVARRAGARSVRVGGTWYLGTLHREDRGVFVGRVGGRDPADVAAAVQAVLSDVGKASTYGDGVLVVSDRAAVLERVRDLVGELQRAQAGTWVVQLQLVAVRDADALAASIGAGGSAELSATIASASAGGPQSQHVARATVAAIAELSGSMDRSAIVADPVFLLRDGGSARVDDGLEVRIVTRAVTEGGAVVDTGFETIQTGLVVDVAVREVDPTEAVLTVSAELSALLGESGGLPVISRRSYTTSAAINSGGVYLLGSIRQAERTREAEGFVRLGSADRSASSVLLVWARAWRVGDAIAPALPDMPAEPAQVTQEKTASGGT